ncbi:hypothetical protein ONZ43_g1578 [Nemania bipapillata]|uniref:Uncharacterized protein n=1 Tax=Nemania bipapillata TaxID=110536 RepID=A0ACC2J429_9PEZI|nr:hypothetical protein ONZ43_g1578 [Nemania bipapillata]
MAHALISHARCITTANLGIAVFAFPVAILWKSRINLRQKLGLTVLFSLVFVTIAITLKGQEQEVTFTWFWFYTEFSVAIIIACILSFRSLFVHQENKAQGRMREQQRLEQAQEIRKGWRLRARQFHDSLITTCKNLEGWSDSDASTVSVFGLPKPQSGMMTVDFEDDANWTRGIQNTEAHVLVERSVSVQSLIRRPAEMHVRGGAVDRDGLH